VVTLNLPPVVRDAVLVSELAGTASASRRRLAVASKTVNAQWSYNLLRTDAHGLRPTTNTELGVDVMQVRFHRPFREKQRAGDFPTA
jgi:hypothetical protein